MQNPLSVASSDLVDPAVGYPWLTRAMVLFRIFGYLTILIGGVEMIQLVMADIDKLGDVLAWIGLFFGVLAYGLATAIAATIQFAFSDAAAAVLGVHRRMNGMS